MDPIEIVADESQRLYDATPAIAVGNEQGLRLMYNRTGKNETIYQKRRSINRTILITLDKWIYCAQFWSGRSWHPWNLPCV